MFWYHMHISYRGRNNIVLSSSITIFYLSDVTIYQNCVLNYRDFEQFKYSIHNILALKRQINYLNLRCWIWCWIVYFFLKSYAVKIMMLLIIIKINNFFVVTLLYVFMVYLTLHLIDNNEADSLLEGYERDEKRYWGFVCVDVKKEAFWGKQKKQLALRWTKKEKKRKTWFYSNRIEEAICEDFTSEDKKKWKITCSI